MIFFVKKFFGDVRFKKLLRLGVTRHRRVPNEFRKKRQNSAKINVLTPKICFRCVLDIVFTFLEFVFIFLDFIFA